MAFATYYSTVTLFELSTARYKSYNRDTRLNGYCFLIPVVDETEQFRAPLPLRHHRVGAEQKVQFPRPGRKPVRSVRTDRDGPGGDGQVPVHGARPAGPPAVPGVGRDKSDADMGAAGARRRREGAGLQGRVQRPDRGRELADGQRLRGEGNAVRHAQSAQRARLRVPRAGEKRRGLQQAVGAHAQLPAEGQGETAVQARHADRAEGRPDVRRSEMGAADLGRRQQDNRVRGREETGRERRVGEVQRLLGVRLQVHRDEPGRGRGLRVPRVRAERGRQKRAELVHHAGEDMRVRRRRETRVRRAAHQQDRAVRQNVDAALRGRGKTDAERQMAQERARDRVRRTVQVRVVQRRFPVALPRGVRAR